MYSLLLALLYLCFVSLGLPDSLLGSAWPVMRMDMAVPVSYAGYVSIITSLGTIFSSAMSAKLVKRFGSGRITAVSIAMTAAALFGFSITRRYWILFLWAVPYGLGAGGVDSVLNNYVALHYKAQHMSWLHCSWGIGASVSPFIMSYALIRLDSWSAGYRIVALIQIVLSAVVFLSLPLWGKTAGKAEDEEKETVQTLSFGEIVRVPGAVPCVLMFFFYCALEVTTSLWASSYLVQNRGITPEIASGFAGLFYLGLTGGRAINGFLAMKLSDRTLIRAGTGIVGAGVLLMLLPLPEFFALAGFLLIGLGCAPIYPCIIHMTPGLFGKERSQSLIGMEMACAYFGFCIMPSVFGMLANRVDIGILPLFLLVLLVSMAVLHEVVGKKTA